MIPFGPDRFGEIHAETYDLLHDPGTTDAAVDLLFEFANGHRTLELAIGTGRLALPLANRGVEMHGFDGSLKMLDKLKEKPGGESISVRVGDMADFDLGLTFGFAYLAFNTLFNLTGQDDQVSCFACTSRHLESGGRFLVEAFVPNEQKLPREGSVRPRRVGDTSLSLDVVQHDPADQTFLQQTVHITEEGIKLHPLPMRYAYPSEIDLMARLAGMRLTDRWGSWERSPFSADSVMHISIYEKL